jgi:hypothetical protein
MRGDEHRAKAGAAQWLTASANNLRAGVFLFLPGALGEDFGMQESHVKDVILCAVAHGVMLWAVRPFLCRGGLNCIHVACELFSLAITAIRAALSSTARCRPTLATRPVRPATPFWAPSRFLDLDLGPIPPLL